MAQIQRPAVVLSGEPLSFRVVVVVVVVVQYSHLAGKTAGVFLRREAELVGGKSEMGGGGGAGGEVVEDSS